MRVTAGTHRGRLLSVPKGDRIRPTSDKVRQALFNMLMTYNLPAAATVIDGFCGSGALGIEALSRGAGFAVFIDKDISTARANIDSLKLDTQSHLIRADITHIGRKPDTLQPAGLVFLDPPYGQDLLPAALDTLASGGWLENKALAVCEYGQGETIRPPAGFTTLDTRRYGTTNLAFLRYGHA